MCSMSPLVLLVFLAASGPARAYWAPANLLDQLRNGTRTWNNYISGESTKIKSFFTGHAGKAQRGRTAAAADMGGGLSSYLAAQQSKLNDDLAGYVESLKESGKKVADFWSYLPREEAGARLEHPARALSVPARSAAAGYRCETHTVLSGGYALAVHRIPASRGGASNGKAVLLQHGIFASSADWILNGPEKALAYALAEAGYDVWMPNVRGNVYSREHAELKTASRSYWNFSWHDAAETDLPNVIDYILQVKGHRREPVELWYVGHSMGTTLLFAMLALRPEYNARLRGAVALAPVVFTEHMRSPLRAMAPLVANVANVEMLYGSHEFKLKDSPLGKLWASCRGSALDALLCKNVVFYVCGANEAQFDRELLPLFLAHLGAGTSWKTVVHFAQLVLSGGGFRRFDYGTEQNARLYGSSAPPEYDLARATLPVTLLWAHNDLLSAPEDVARLAAALPRARSEPIEDPAFSHVDYLWARDAPTLVNAKVLAALEGRL